MEKKLLITGFEPFGGETVNPSWEAVQRLPDKIGSFQLTKLQISVEYGKAAEIVVKQASLCKPDVILCVGQAGKRSGVTPEAVAINLRDTASPDNAGLLQQNVPVIPGGPDAYFATVPVRDMVKAIQAANIPASLSLSAGAYVCNDVLYTLLHRYHDSETQVGFIHVPYLPQQAKEGIPSLTLEQITDALIAAVEALS
ncbi:MAG: pyroglutamyl-peptidase I [Oscillospiraceae bacterium]|nr:pyroglutamyl-peptidase I [Oscillospiraceae bacterium]